MKTKIENEVFFIDEKKYFRALSEMENYTSTCNRIAEIIQENDLKITPTNAMELIFTTFDTLNRAIVENWRKQRRNDLTGLVLQTRTPDINQIPILQNSLTYLGTYNAGFIPGDFLKFENGLFCTDENKLKEFFTLYKTPAINEIAENVESFLKSYEHLKLTAKKFGIKNLIDFQGILQFDAYSESFSFNKTSLDLFQIQRTAVNNRKKTGT